MDTAHMPIITVKLITVWLTCIMRQVEKERACLESD